MSADRLLATKPRADAAAVERKRAADLATHLADVALVERGYMVGHCDVKDMLSQFAFKLVALATVIRDGGDAADLDAKLEPKPKA